MDFTECHRMVRSTCHGHVRTWKCGAGRKSITYTKSHLCVSVSELVSNSNSGPIAEDDADRRSRDGDDGPWSSFTLRIGTPAQDVRVMISTAGQETWVVLPEGCPASDSSCPDQRGQTYIMNSSSTWHQTGFYELYIEQNLNITGNAQVGNETVGLGLQGSGGPTLNDQIVGGIATTDFWVGMFGINPKPTNFTTLDEGQASYMTSLKDQNMIPSLSVGYTAGNQYREYYIQTSLVLS